MDLNLLLKGAALVYFFATLSFVFYVLIRNIASRVPTLVLLAGFVLHTAALASHFFHEGYPATENNAVNPVPFMQSKGAQL